MVGQKLVSTPAASASNPKIDGNDIIPRSSRSRFIPGGIAFLIFLGIAALYISATHFLNITPTTMAHPPASDDIPVLPITVSLSPLPSPPDAAADTKPSFRITVTLTNTGDAPLIILKWRTPLVHGAPAMGIFKVTDLRSGTAVPDMGLMIDYLLPDGDTFVLRKGEDSSQDLVLIRQGESVGEEVRIGNPEVKVEGGRTYSVKAVGRWMAVWVGESEDGRYWMGDSIGNGRFESEAVEVQT